VHCVARTQVITSSVVKGYAGQITGLDRMHLNVLGEFALTYHDERSFVDRLTSLDRLAARQQGELWNRYRSYAPEAVMRTFARVFFNGTSCGSRTTSAARGRWQGRSKRW
jgi:hypothetical protein